MAAAEDTQEQAIPLTPSERQNWADIEWAQQDTEIRQRYTGEWVALYDRRVHAHGPDYDQVLHRAAQTSRIPATDLAMWFITDDDSLLTGPAPGEQAS